MKRTIVACVALALAACSERPLPPPDAPTGSAEPKPTPDTPPITAPAGVSANAQMPPPAPAGAGVWVVDATKTSVTAAVATKGGGKLACSFAGGVAGALDGESGKGVITVDLTRLESADAAGKSNPARDAALIEAFFGARAAKKPEVQARWRALGGKLAAVSRAALVIDKVPIPVSMIVSPPAKVNPDYIEKTTLEAKLILWNSVAIPISLPIEMSRRGALLEVKSSSPAKVGISDAVGSVIHGWLIDATVEAGYAEARDAGAEVELSFKATLTLSGAP